MSEQNKISKLHNLVQVAIDQLLYQIADIRQSFLLRCQNQGQDAICNPLNVMALQLIFQMQEELLSIASTIDDYSYSQISDVWFNNSDPVLQLFAVGFLQRCDTATKILKNFNVGENDLNVLMNLAKILPNLAKRLETHQKVESLERDTETKIKNLLSSELSQSALQAAYREQLQEQTNITTKLLSLKDELLSNVELEQKKLHELENKK